MLTAVALGAAARHFAAVERRLFEIVGGWVPTVGEPEVKVALRLASFRHAWHAELWDGLVREGPPAPAVGVVEGLVGAASTAQRLTGMYAVVLPELIGAYERRLEVATADVAAGGAAVRVLTLALADDRAELAAGRQLLDGVGMDSAYAAHLGASGGVELQDSSEGDEGP